MRVIPAITREAMRIYREDGGPLWLHHYDPDDHDVNKRDALDIAEALELTAANARKAAAHIREELAKCAYRATVETKLAKEEKQ